MRTELRDFMEWLEDYDVFRGRSRILDEVDLLIGQVAAAEIDAPEDTAAAVSLVVERIMAHVESHYCESPLRAEFDAARSLGWRPLSRSPHGSLSSIYEPPSLWRRALRLAPGIEQAKRAADDLARDSLFLDGCILHAATAVESSFSPGDPDLERLCERYCAVLGQPQGNASPLCSAIVSDLNRAFFARVLEPFKAAEYKRDLDLELELSAT
jgi:hypothetical protein